MRRGDEVIKKIVGVLTEFGEVELGYIFGSFHEGRESRDIDVAVLLSTPLPAYGSERLAMRLALGIEKALDYEFELDVKVLNHSPVYFQHEVVKRGRLIFCRDETKRVRYEARLLSEYMDYREVLDWFDEQMLARV